MSCRVEPSKKLHFMLYSNISTEATAFGNKNEDVAVENKADPQTTCKEVGLLVSMDRLWLRASLYRLVTDSTGEGGLEVKCPASRRGKSAYAIVSDSSFCLGKDNKAQLLKRMVASGGVVVRALDHEAGPVFDSKSYPGHNKIRMVIRKYNVKKVNERNFDRATDEMLIWCPYLSTDVGIAAIKKAIKKNVFICPSHMKEFLEDKTIMEKFERLSANRPTRLRPSGPAAMETIPEQEEEKANEVALQQIDPHQTPVSNLRRIISSLAKGIIGGKERKLRLPELIKLFSAYQVYLRAKDAAVEEYLKSLKSENPEATCEEAGLILSLERPWLGASVDRLVLSNGEVTGGLEVKCPHSKKGQSTHEAVQDKTFFLTLHPPHDKRNNDANQGTSMTKEQQSTKSCDKLDTLEKAMMGLEESLAGVKPSTKTRSSTSADPRKWYKAIKEMTNTSKRQPCIAVPGIQPSSPKTAANAINVHLATASQQHVPLELQDIPA
ncbi:hypothetical protein Bbelb_283920 [Branchiostoma belcheri]|nr:hypothetical protein Bbelb_283920 [Branchiostoma belcheri]